MNSKVLSPLVPTVIATLIWHRVYFQRSLDPVGTTKVCSGDLWRFEALPPFSVVLLHPRYNLPLPARHNRSILKHLKIRHPAFAFLRGLCFKCTTQSKGKKYLWNGNESWSSSSQSLHNLFYFCRALPPLSLCQTQGPGPWSGIWNCLVCLQQPWSLAVSLLPACKNTLSVTIYAFVHPRIH